MHLSKEHLILFTRYPEPGLAKTRLIPVLEAEGAASLHRQMAEHTLMQAKKLRSHRDISLEIQFTGGTVAQMQSWLGMELIYVAQGQGELGDRMFIAFQRAFDQNAAFVIIIGTDCPELDAGILEQAFEALQQHDLVLGPARDGGYYLIGLQRLVPQLFQGIAWSTTIVLQQTVEIAERAGLTIAYLPSLSDVDHPADLEIWHGIQR